MKVTYYVCKTSNLRYFSYSNKYIRVRNSNFEGRGIYLNCNHELECVDDYLFELDTNKLSVMEVYAIYSSADGSVLAGTKYGVYKVDSDGDYYVFTEKFRFEYLPKGWFVPCKDVSGLTGEQFRDYCKEHIEYCKRLDNTSAKQEDKMKLEEIERKKKEKIDLINTISNTIAKNTGVSITTTITKMPKITFWTLISLTILAAVLGIATQNVLLGMVATQIFLVTMFGRKKEATIVDKEIAIDLQNYERLNAMNKLPLDLLGKIQQLQNYMTIMRYREVSEDIIGLVEQSVNLTVFTTIQDDYYSSNTEEINKRLNEFLDNTLEYVKTSLQNKDMEIYQIKKNLSKDYLKMIDDNSEMFKSITKDLGQISNIFDEKKEESNPEEVVKEETKE